jgi:hypothetical protein
MASLEGVAAAAKAPVGWAKARPVVFFLLALLVALLAIRFRNGILSAIAKIPVIGGPIGRIAGVSSAPPPTAGTAPS